MTHENKVRHFMNTKTLSQLGLTLCLILLAQSGVLANKESTEVQKLPVNPDGHGIPYDLQETDFVGNFKDIWEYFNVKFDFIVRYPCALIPQNESDDGSGQLFKARDSSAQLATFGAVRERASLSEELKTTLAQKLQAGEIVDNKRVGNDYFVIASHKDGKNNLTKVIVTRSKVLRFDLCYKDEKKRIYDGLAERMAASFYVAHQSDFDPVADAKRVVVLPNATNTKQREFAYKTYKSKTCRFSVDYPSEFRGEIGKEMLDVSDASKTISISAQGAEATDYDSGAVLDLRKLYRDELHFAPDRKILLKECGNSSFQITSVDKDNVVTCKRAVYDSSMSKLPFVKTVEIRYPLKRHSALVSMIKRVTASLRNTN